MGRISQNGAFRAQRRTKLALVRKNYCNNSNKLLAETLGIKPAACSNYTTGQRTIPEEQWERFKQIFADRIDPEWWDAPLPEEESRESLRVLRTKNTIPLIPISAMAGYPTSSADGVTDYNALYTIPEFKSLGADFLIRASGDSMYPHIHDGDLLACRKITEIEFLQWGKIYVIDTEQGVLVKRLFEGHSKNAIVCHSENTSSYPDFEIPKASILSISIVLGHIGLE